MVQQVEFSLSPKRKGFHLVTQEIMKNLPVLPEQGILNLFVKHTSCALSINENYDPSVRSDMEQIYNRLVKTNEPYYSHTDEGGTWQGIYLCEFRYSGGARKIVATIMS